MFQILIQLSCCVKYFAKTPLSAAELKCCNCQKSVCYANCVRLKHHHVFCEELRSRWFEICAHMCRLERSKLSSTNFFAYFYPSNDDSKFAGLDTTLGRLNTHRYCVIPFSKVVMIDKELVLTPLHVTYYTVLCYLSKHLLMDTYHLHNKRAPAKAHHTQAQAEAQSRA